MSRGPGRWQRAALELLDEQRGEMLFGKPLRRWTLSTALRRTLDGFAAQGRLGKRARKYMYRGPRDIVWFKRLNRGDYRISPLIVG